MTEGESVELHTGISGLKSEENVKWRYESKDVVRLIAEINEKTKEISFNNKDEQFKHRLHLNQQTGSLTITNIKSTDAGGYELHITSKNTTSYKKFNVLVWSEYINPVRLRNRLTLIFSIILFFSLCSEHIKAHIG